MKKPLVSIIVPVYNVEKYLHKCIGSLLKQTYGNLEIILVDDGSTDESRRLCDTFVAVDSRIKVVHKKNGGVSTARNAGIKIAKGLYICFVDGDDYVARNYVKYLLQAAQDNDADIAVCGLRKVTTTERLNREVADPGILETESAIKRMFMSEEISEVVIWNKIYRRSLFTKNELTFPVNKTYCEDVFIAYKLYDVSSRIVYIADVLYFYMQRKLSIISKGYNKEWLDSLELHDEIVEDIKIKRPSLSKAAYKFRLRFTFTLAGEICKRSTLDVEALKTLSSWTRKNKSNLIFNQYISPSKKLRAFILMLGWRVYIFGSRIARTNGRFA